MKKTQENFVFKNRDNVMYIIFKKYILLYVYCIYDREKRIRSIVVKICL